MKTLTGFLLACIGLPASGLAYAWGYIFITIRAWIRRLISWLQQPVDCSYFFSSWESSVND